MSRPLLLGSMLALAHAGCKKCGDELNLTNDENYSYTGTVDLPVIETAANVDIEICFDQLTDDIQCHDTDPVVDVVNVGMSRWDLTPQEINDKIANDTLQASDVEGYVDVTTDGATCVHTNMMSFFGTDLDVKKEYYVGPTYLVFVSSSLTPAVGSRALVMLVPSKDSTVTRVDVPSECGDLMFDADLGSMNSLSVCEKGSTKVDWSAVDTNGVGNPFSPASVDQLMLAHYDELTASDLEESFFDLQLLADDLWTAPLLGDVKADLKDAVTASGDTFNGFESSGIYLLALNETSSPNPAPKFLTVLTPE